MGISHQCSYAAGGLCEWLPSFGIPFAGLVQMVAGVRAPSFLWPSKIPSGVHMDTSFPPNPVEALLANMKNVAKTIHMQLSAYNVSFQFSGALDSEALNYYNFVTFFDVWQGKSLPDVL